VFSVRQELSVEGSQPVASGLRSPAAARARSLTRERVTTTPGKLVVLSILVVLGACAFALSATLAERSRAQAAQAVAKQTEPLLLQSALLYTSLSDANATATATFLSGGLEPPARRAHYLADLRLASDSLTTLTRELGSSSSTAGAIRTVTQELPVYAGLVESARANNRQGFPVGAAYLRAASALLTRTILPQANRIYAAEAGQLKDEYSTGTGTTAVVVLVIAVVLALGLLLLAQRYLARMSHRILNVPTLVATALVAALAIWALIGVVNEQNALARARRRSDEVEVLTASRVLLARAQSDQSLILANRGSDETDPADFSAVTAALNGLLHEVPTLAGPVGQAAAARRLESEFGSYQAETAKVTALASNGLIGTATSLGTSNAVAGRFDADLSSQASAAQRGFAGAAGDATSALTGLSIALPVLALLAGALAVVGIRQRLGEYR
jgi:hypothetical protein